ncbi:DUF4403 domain-containing protein containing protein [Pelomyxa schiedti]|nr:DUF4403 domain-containing protein containing protein [Pelomyxa schiedti]
MISVMSVSLFFRQRPVQKRPNKRTPLVDPPKKPIKSKPCRCIGVLAAVFITTLFLLAEYLSSRPAYIPAPAEFPSASVPIQGRDSTVSVNIDLNLFSLVVPRYLDNWLNEGDWSFHYLLKSDGSPQGTTVEIVHFSGKDGHIHLDNGHASCIVSGVSSPNPGTVKVDISFWGAVKLRRRVVTSLEKTSDFAGTLSCTVPISLTNDWHIISNPSVQVSVIRAKTFFGWSWEPRLRAGMEKILIPKILELVSQVPSLCEKFNLMWQHLHDAMLIPTVELQDYKVEDVWLQINPNALSMSPLTFAGEWMHVSIGLSCKPVISVGYYPASSSPTMECPSFSTMIADQGIDTELTFHLPFTVLNTETLRLPPTVITIWGVQVEVKSVQFYASERTLVAAVVTQSIFGNATIYLWGELQWNSTNSTLSFSVVDFHPEPRNYLSKMALFTADWLFHGHVKELISRKLHWNLGAHLENLRQYIRDSHRSDHWADYNFVMQTLDIQSVVAEASGITLVGSLTGQGSVSVKSDLKLTDLT